jgi:hypothetical protein
MLMRTGTDYPDQNRRAAAALANSIGIVATQKAAAL